MNKIGWYSKIVKKRKEHFVTLVRFPNLKDRAQP